MGDKKLGILAIHGMGDRKPKFADKIEEKLKKKIGDNFLEKVHFEKIYYQEFLQKNQDDLFKQMKKEEIDGIWLRKFFLYSFSDALAVERKPEQKGSPYEQVQQIIYDALDRCLAKLENTETPVFIIAHSLGCQVISNYIWDAQAKSPNQGIWKNKAKNKQSDFYRLKTLRNLFTTGCNIPLFIAGYDRKTIVPIETKKDGYNIDWYNYYDRDDVLGWPLQPINPNYKNAVKKDIEINVGGLLTKWNFFSHTQYWKDSDFIDPLADNIKKYI